MKSKLLLPNRYKWIGLLMLLPFLVIGALFFYADFTVEWLHFAVPADGIFDAGNDNLTDEVALTGMIISLLLIAFAREKEEDEFIHLTRLESWQWAVLVTFALLLAATWLFYGADFLNIMVYNMLTVLIIFIVRFQWLVYRSKKEEVKSLAL